MPSHLQTARQLRTFSGDCPADFLEEAPHFVLPVRVLPYFEWLFLAGDAEESNLNHSAIQSHEVVDLPQPPHRHAVHRSALPLQAPPRPARGGGTGAVGEVGEHGREEAGVGLRPQGLADQLVVAVHCVAVEAQVGEREKGVGRSHPLLQVGQSVRPREPGVAQDLRHAPRAQPDRLLLAQQTLQETDDGRGEERGVGRLGVDCCLVDLLRVAAVEGRQASHQFVEQRPQTVEVRSQSVSTLRDDLRRHVLRTPAEGESLSAGHAKLDHSEVSDADVSLPIQQYVLGLDVAVGDAVGVQFLQAEQNLHNVEATDCLTHLPAALDQGEQFATGVVLQDEDHVAAAFQAAVQLREEGVRQLHHHLPLPHHQSLLPHQQLLPQQLHRVEPPVLPAPHQEHPRKPPAPHRPLDLELLQAPSRLAAEADRLNEQLHLAEGLRFGLCKRQVVVDSQVARHTLEDDLLQSAPPQLQSLFNVLQHLPHRGALRPQLVKLAAAFDSHRQALPFLPPGLPIEGIGLPPHLQYAALAADHIG